MERRHFYNKEALSVRGRKERKKNAKLVNKIKMEIGERETNKERWKQETANGASAANGFKQAVSCRNRTKMANTIGCLILQRKSGKRGSRNK